METVIVARSHLSLTHKSLLHTYTHNTLTQVTPGSLFFSYTHTLSHPTANHTSLKSETNKPVSSTRRQQVLDTLDTQTQCHLWSIPPVSSFISDPKSQSLVPKQHRDAQSRIRTWYDIWLIYEHCLFEAVSSPQLMADKRRFYLVAACCSTFSAALCKRRSSNGMEEEERRGERRCGVRVERTNIVLVWARV